MDIEDPTPVKKRPNGHLRQRWFSREELDGRTRAAKMFEHVEASVIEDLGGEDNISAVQRHLISAFAGMAVCLEDLNVRIMLGEQVDLNALRHAAAHSSELPTELASEGYLVMCRRRSQICFARNSKRPRMNKTFTIDKVLTDPRLLGSQLGDISTWSTWLAILKAAFALPLDATELETFNAVTGNRPLPKKGSRELWVAAGRRGGKSRMAAALAIFFALFQQHKLSAGEHAMVLVLAASMDQAKVVFGYVHAFLQNSEVLRREIKSSTRSEIRLKNGIVIAVHSNSFRSVRGRTLCAAIFDEVSFWRSDDSAAPDTETYTAILPALLTTNGMLVGISSPYRRTGLLHAKYKRYFGTDSDDTLVVQGSSLTFNRTLNEAAIQAQREADPTAARSEWDADFRDDISGFLDEH